MLMVTSMMDTGKMIKLMAKVFTVILMALNTRVNGKRINNMEEVLRHGQTELAMKEIMLKERSME
jgi:hypothetical protein